MYSTFEQYKTDGGALPEDQYNVLAKQAAYMIDAAPGDVLVLGEASDTVTGSSALTGKYHGRCFVVTHVQDNRRGPRSAWHWKIKGK